MLWNIWDIWNLESPRSNFRISGAKSRERHYIHLRFASGHSDGSHRGPHGHVGIVELLEGRWCSGRHVAVITHHVDVRMLASWCQMVRGWTRGVVRWISAGHAGGRWSLE